MREWIRSIDWLSISTSALILVIVILIIGPVAPRESHQPNYKLGEAESCEPALHDTPAEVFRLRLQCDPAAYFTLWLAIFSAVLTITTFAQIGFLIRADGTARTSANAAKRSAEAAIAAQRPWIKIDASISGSLTDHGVGGLRLPFTVMLQNVGNSPAVNVNVWIALACSGGVINYLEAREKITPVPEGWGFSLFPSVNPDDPPEIIDRWGGLSVEEVESALAATKATGLITLGVVVAAEYRFIGGCGETTVIYGIDGPGLLGMTDVRRLPILGANFNLRRLEGADTAT
jgi:hypothetical protein